MPSRREKKQQRKEYQRLYAMASLLLPQGRAEEAIPLLESAVEIASSIGDDAGVGEAELLLSGAYSAIGAIGEEHQRLQLLHVERAVEAFGRAGDRDGLVAALSWQAIRYNESHDAANLEQTLDELANVDRKAGRWWRTYSDGVAAMLDDPERSMALLRVAVESAGDLPTRNREHWRSQALRHLELVGGAASQTDASERRRRKLLNALGPSDSVTEKTGEGAASWTSLFADAIAAIGTEDDRVLERRFDVAIEAAEEMRRRIRSEVKQRELSETTSPLYSAKASLASRAGRYADAVDAIELNTSRSLVSVSALEELWARSPVQSWEPLGEAKAQIQGAAGRYQDSPSQAGWDELMKALERRRQASHWVQEQLVGLVPPPHQLYLPSDSAGLRESMAEDDLVLIFTDQGPTYAVRSSGVSRVSTIDVELLDAALRRYRTLASSPGRPHPDRELDDTEAEIVAHCFEPLEVILTGVRRLLIVPCGQLWGVPLATVGPRPLCERFAIGVVPSLSAAHRLLKHPRPTPASDRFVGLGNPDESLPGAGLEVERAAANFDNSVALTGSAVEFESLGLLSDADVIHLACHGVAFNDYPELSYLHVAGSHDEPLLWFAEEVVRVAMNPRLAVLSACDAGTSTALPGNEYIGFPGLFLTAGAASVVAPLWRIADESTAALMDVFYRALPGSSVSAALWAAQQSVRASPDTAARFHWAGFQVFGLP